MAISPPEEITSTAERPEPTELLIKEARNLERRRWLTFALALFILIGAALGIASLLGTGSGAPRTKTGVPARPQVMTIPSLGRGARIWTIDMVTTRAGYAVAGISSSNRYQLLLKTTNSGNSWSIVARLPYSYEASLNKPLLHFVNSSIGYTHSLSSDAEPIYMTVNGGATWRTLSVDGTLPPGVGGSTSPAYQISNDAVAVISERCKPFEYSTTCSAMLSDYHWGTRTPFRVNSVAPIGKYSRYSTHHWALVVAPSVSTALVAEDSMSGATPVRSLEFTTNGGQSWLAASNPCRATGVEPPGSFNAVALNPTRWLMNCSWYSGAGPTTVLLRQSVNDGRTWSTVDFDPVFSAKSSASISGETDNVWSSNEGTVLWSYSMSGVRVSKNGGRTWSRIVIVGKKTINDVGAGGQLEFAPIGPAGTFLVSTTGQVYRSNNGVTFASFRVIQRH